MIWEISEKTVRSKTENATASIVADWCKKLSRVMRNLKLFAFTHIESFS